MFMKEVLSGAHGVACGSVPPWAKVLLTNETFGSFALNDFSPDTQTEKKGNMNFHMGILLNGQTAEIHGPEMHGNMPQDVTTFLDGEPTEVWGPQAHRNVLQGLATLLDCKSTELHRAKSFRHVPENFTTLAYRNTKEFLLCAHLFRVIQKTAGKVHHRNSAQTFFLLFGHCLQRPDAEVLHVSKGKLLDHLRFDSPDILEP